MKMAVLCSNSKTNRRSVSPGPGQYTVRSSTHCQTYSFNRTPRDKFSKYLKTEVGPGSYNIILAQPSPAAIFTSKKSTKSIDETPGPAHYKIKEEIVKFRNQQPIITNPSA